VKTPSANPGAILGAKANKNASKMKNQEAVPEYALWSGRGKKIFYKGKVPQSVHTLW